LRRQAWPRQGVSRSSTRRPTHNMDLQGEVAVEEPHICVTSGAFQSQSCIGLLS